MGVTEQTIIDQFPYWQRAIRPLNPLPAAAMTVFVGCGTSYNLALALAALSNGAHRPAIAVPGGEWLSRPASYWPDWSHAHVVALSRSGETTETVAAARASRAAGASVTAITCEKQSELAKNCDRLLHAETDPAEGIVMTTSASLMLLLGLQLLGYVIEAPAIEVAKGLLGGLDARLPALLEGRTHFAFLGGGALYGVALEAALKMQEMSQIFTQAFHPLEYRHGPVSLVDAATIAVMLYGDVQPEGEARLARELSQKGALVVGFGGWGDITLPVQIGAPLAGLVALPALQMLGERAAQARHIDTTAPRHLTKVVTLG